MSKNLNNAMESLGDWEPESIIFDKYEQFSEDKVRLEDAVLAGVLTPSEATELINQYRQMYGLE